MRFHAERPYAAESRAVNSRDAGTAKRPNFLVIGTAKSGSTALWHYLRQHPQVYMSPRKHTRFFSYAVEDPGFCGPRLESESVP